MKEDNHIFWRDEILQLLFWMRGEGMGESHAPSAVARYLDVKEESLRPHLTAMVEAGYLSMAGDQFALTEMGRSEGARRFKDEFESLLGQGHGECNDPDCDCHELGPEHCTSHSSHERVN